jgi:integrase
MGWMGLADQRCAEAVGVDARAAGPSKAEAVRWRRPAAPQAPRLIEERPGLRPKTVQLYRYLLRSHIDPAFGARSLADIKEPHVRRWRKNLLDAQVSAVTVAKAYRLLKAIFNTAVDDGLIQRNPCRIKGAGQEKSPERPVLTVPEVYILAGAVDGRYRALVLLGVFSSLRWGELAALRRSDIDMQAHTVRVSRQLSEKRGGGFAFAPPKSDAGQRMVAIPEVITSDLASHVVTYAAPGDDGLVFASPKGLHCGSVTSAAASGGQPSARPDSR